MPLQRESRPMTKICMRLITYLPCNNEGTQHEYDKNFGNRLQKTEVGYTARRKEHSFPTSLMKPSRVAKRSLHRIARSAVARPTMPKLAESRLNLPRVSPPDSICFSFSR